jgi:hypothetical protein
MKEFLEMEHLQALGEVVDWYLFLSHLENGHNTPATRHISRLSND